MKEDILIAQKAKSNPDAFENIYTKYFDQIYKYCHTRIFSSHDAEDLTMQVFADAFVNFKKFKWQNKPIVAWLYGIAHNHLYDFKKAKAKYKTFELDKIGTRHNHDDIAENIASKDQATNLMRYFRKLPDVYQQVIFLRLCEDKSFSEISLIVGKKETACRVLAHRALQKLKKEAARGGVLDA